MWYLAVVCAIGFVCVSGQCDDATRPLPVTTPQPIRSPGFDGTTPYADNLLCEWSITSPQDILMRLTQFGLEDCVDCACDYLSIYDGPDDTYPLIQTLCGGNLDILPLDIVADSTMFIRFQTDTGNSGDVIGFSSTVAFVDAACDTNVGKDLVGPVGTILSPNYPGNYPTSTDCQWNFKAPFGQLVELELNALDLEDGCNPGFGQGVVFDYIQFVESDARTSLGRFFGNEFVPGFKFRNYLGNQPYLQFWSDSSTTGTGFNMTYRFV